MNYLAYWNYKDWVDTRNEPPAYYSDAGILEDMAVGSELWLFTRKRGNQTIHVVQRIIIELHPLPPPGGKRYAVAGEGLANPRTIQLTQTAIDTESNSWLGVLSQMITLCGKHLASETAGGFARKFMCPREITAESAEMLTAEWQTRFG